jgi:6-pyruvoyltetrahydropterin/6-carboxytetrahydropterin synthase
MYTIKKRLEISASHSLKLNYESKCENLHGHNWIITVYCRTEKLNKNGMVTDFSLLNDQVKRMLDHRNLNEVFDFNTTAENIAFWLVENVENCYRADVRESENNTASYERD